MIFARRTLVACLAALGGCSGGSGGPHALFTLHPPTDNTGSPTADEDFYSLPFPNDLRLRSDGSIDLSSYPHSVGTVAQYIDIIGSEPVGGFATQGGVFFRFDGPLDPASFPSPAASISSDRAVLLVDVTATSPTYDQPTPVQVHFVSDAYDFIGPNWLCVLPVPGFPLRERTTYAAILTDKLTGLDGKRAQPSADFLAARRGAAGAPYAPLVAWLGSHPTLAPHVIDAAVFTTRDATSVMATLRAAVYAQSPAPSFDGLRDHGTIAAANGTPVAELYEATYAAPIFQVGSAPYFGGGGNIVRDGSGVPIVQTITPLRVALTVPLGPAPAGGWPVVLYQHGTGGDYETFVRDGSAASAARVTDASGSVVGQLAMLSIDAVENGARVPDGTDNDIAFFNFLNLHAIHDNVLQGAADGFQMVRLVHAARPGSGLPFALDATRILYKGHSQGGLVGPLFLAAEPEVHAAVLSGAGGDLIYTLLNKTEPNNIPAIVQGFLHDPLDAYHPLLSLIQGYFEDADPTNYGRLQFAEPLNGIAPKSIFQSLGIVDHVTPIPNIEALALAMGVQPVRPDRRDIDGLQLTSIPWGIAPVAGNVSNGAATGVLVEYPAAPGSDGHFVIFDDGDATAQSNRFLASTLDRKAARLDPP